MLFFLSDIIHNIYDVIFSVIYRPPSNPVSIPIKIKIFGSIIFIMHLTTILTHDKTVLDQSHRTATKISLGLTGVLGLLITKDTITLTLLDQYLVNFFITHNIINLYGLK